MNNKILNMDERFLEQRQALLQKAKTFKPVKNPKKGSMRDSMKYIMGLKPSPQIISEGARSIFSEMGVPIEDVTNIMNLYMEYEFRAEQGDKAIDNHIQMILGRDKESQELKETCIRNRKWEDLKFKQLDIKEKQVEAMSLFKKNHIAPEEKDNIINQIKNYQESINEIEEQLMKLDKKRTKEFYAW